MAPKKIDVARRAKKVFIPTRANPRISKENKEDTSSDDDEGFNPPLNKEGLN